jgi:hypothetical protein
LKNFENKISKFKFPYKYLEIVELGMIDLKYWFFLSNDLISFRFYDLKKRYKNRNLVPFAGRYDCDDIACFEIGHGERVFIVHDFASEGWERRKEYDTFGDWLLEAVKELVDGGYN